MTMANDMRDAKQQTAAAMREASPVILCCVAFNVFHPSVIAAVRGAVSTGERTLHNNNTTAQITTKTTAKQQLRHESSVLLLWLPFTYGRDLKPRSTRPRDTFSVSFWLMQYLTAGGSRTRQNLFRTVCVRARACECQLQARDAGSVTRTHTMPLLPEKCCVMMPAIWSRARAPSAFFTTLNAHISIIPKSWVNLKPNPQTLTPNPIPVHKVGAVGWRAKHHPPHLQYRLHVVDDAGRCGGCECQQRHALKLAGCGMWVRMKKGARKEMGARGIE